MRITNLPFIGFLCIVFFCTAAELQPRQKISGEDVDQAEAAGLHTYKADLEEALSKHERGLRAVLGLAVQNIFDSAGAESYNGRLGYLLKLWGDHAFAISLGKESKTIREAIIRELDEYAIAEQMRRFPETSALAQHPNFDVK